MLPSCRTLAAKDREGLSSVSTKALRICQASVTHVQARKRHMKTNFLVWLHIGRTRGCPRDKPALSWDKHNGSPVCPWDKPGSSLGLTRGRTAAEQVYVLEVYAPLLLLNVGWRFSSNKRLRAHRENILAFCILEKSHRRDSMTAHTTHTKRETVTEF